MAFDGITVAALRCELESKLLGGRLYKIAQPENDELILTIKQPDATHRLLISADASLPLIYITEDNKPSPLTAPGFCMLLRKHLSNGRITAITQPGLERIIRIEVEHLDEMGDLKTKTLIIEIMGKHSNIIFCDENDMIIDSIKHISAAVSSVREVLPGRNYFIPKTTDKKELLDSDSDSIKDTLVSCPMPAFKAIYNSYTGISPALANELCYRAGIDGNESCNCLGEDKLCKLVYVLSSFANDIKNGIFSPCVVYENNSPREYAAITLTSFAERKSYTSISELLCNYYQEKNKVSRIRQRSYDLRHILTTLLERNVKKYDLQCKQLKDTESRDKYRIYGELLNAFGYSIPGGSKSATVNNYYTGEDITIPLDETLTVSENAQRYFDKYGKLKRTSEALTELTIQVHDEITHIESVLTALDIAMSEEDLTQIREEMVLSGYIRAKSGSKKVKITNKPYHYITEDGYEIFVGKNNLQNDELTFKFANGGDWWFHAKKIPGSHVILRSHGLEEPSDQAFEAAAHLAAYYSKGRDQEKIEVDYVIKKEVKKPAGAKPGFVVYYTNYSMAVSSDISMVKEV